MNSLGIWIREWLVEQVLRWGAIGGHCGLCGKWVERCLVPSYWRITICDSCAAITGEETK